MLLQYYFSCCISTEEQLKRNMRGVSTRTNLQIFMIKSLMRIILKIKSRPCFVRSNHEFLQTYYPHIRPQLKCFNFSNVHAPKTDALARILSCPEAATTCLAGAPQFDVDMRRYMCTRPGCESNKSFTSHTQVNQRSIIGHAHKGHRSWLHGFFLCVIVVLGPFCDCVFVFG